MEGRTLKLPIRKEYRGYKEKMPWYGWVLSLMLLGEMVFLFIYALAQ